MIEIIVFAIIALSVSLVMAVLWVYRKLSGPQIFQRTLPSRNYNLSRMNRKNQQGYIHFFSEFVIRKEDAINKGKSGKEIKAPWGW